MDTRTFTLTLRIYSFFLVLLLIQIYIKRKTKKNYNKNIFKFRYAPIAFEELMIHGMSHVTLPFAICCVRHRYKSQDIHRWETFKLLLFHIKNALHLETKNRFNVIFFLFILEKTFYNFFYLISISELNTVNQFTNQRLT